MLQTTMQEENTTYTLLEISDLVTYFSDKYFSSPISDEISDEKLS